MLERLSAFLQARCVDFETFGTVFDIGSRDGLQAIELSKLFANASVIAVECNNATLDMCRRNIAGHSRIRLIDKAINAFTGRCPFYPIDPSRTVTTWADGNPGASSLFIATHDYPVETYVQNQTEVECTRLDDLCQQLDIDVVDLIWMDLQGAELLALQSAGSVLDRVRYIYTEVSHRPIYSGQCLFDDVDAFLSARGFRLCTKVDRNRWQQNLIYENSRTLIDVFIPAARENNAVLDLAVHSVRKFVKNVRTIYVTGTEDAGVKGARFIDPTMLSFTSDSKITPPCPGENASAHFRQLAKLYMPMTCQGALEHVLAADASTIFLNPCQFIDEGRPIFNFGDDNNDVALDQMTQLYPVLRRMFSYSAATGCMLFKRTWLRELHAAVEACHDGMPFWQAYLEASDAGSPGLRGLESEIYFNFALMFHSDALIIRRFHWDEINAFKDEHFKRCDYVTLAHPDRLTEDELSRLQDVVLGDDLCVLGSSQRRLGLSAAVSRNA
jgi:FkbM family methyltransferase